MQHVPQMPQAKNLLLEHSASTCLTLPQTSRKNRQEKNQDLPQTKDLPQTLEFSEARKESKVPHLQPTSNHTGAKHGDIKMLTEPELSQSQLASRCLRLSKGLNKRS